MNKHLYFVFDVESVGLHGEAFEVGYVVVNKFGIILEEKHFVAPMAQAVGTLQDRIWCENNIPIANVTHNTLLSLREDFWVAWQNWRSLGALMVVDCGWPVEAGFLSACVKDHAIERAWSGPYPLIDISTLAVALDINPLTAVPRLPTELPVHNPLSDARQTARLLLAMLDRVSKSAEPSQILSDLSPAV